MQRYQVITDDQLDKIHENSLRIMREVGIIMPYEPAKELLKKHGCTIEGDLVKFPREVVEQAIESCPNHYTLHGRNPKYDVLINTKRVATAGPWGSPFVLDMDNGRRRSNLQDFINIVKICDKLSGLEIQSHNMCEPSNVSEDERPLTMVYNTMKYSAKPLMGSVFGYQTTKDCIELASLPFGGLDAVRDKPIIASIPCTLTPLAYKPSQLGAIRAYAEYGQIQLINSLSIAGMTVPCTLAGLVSLQNAEVLAGITYAQLVRPGCPVVYSASGSNAEMSYGVLSIGSPEDFIVSCINGQLCKRYDIPCRISGALSDSKLLDAQAAYESAITYSAAQMAGGNFILHSMGIIETYNTVSFEKLIIDNEIINYYRRIERGIEVDEETLAFDVIKEVGPQGIFISEDHTLDNFRDEFYQPEFSDRQLHDMWVSHGSLTAEQRANAEWKRLVSISGSTIDAELEKELRAFVKSKYGDIACLDLGVTETAAALS